MVKEGLVHKCLEAVGNSDSVSLHEDSVYFASHKQALMVLDLKDLSEKPLLDGVFAFSGVPSSWNFIAVSSAGVLQSTDKKRTLIETFPRMHECYWTAILAVGHYAVVAGNSKFCLSEGVQLQKPSNYFLLVSLATLEVVNHLNPIAFSYFDAEGMPRVSYFRVRGHHHHSML